MRNYSLSYWFFAQCRLTSFVGLNAFTQFIELVYVLFNFGIFHIQYNPQFFELFNPPLGVVGLSRRAVISSEYLKVPSSILGAETLFLLVRLFADINLFLLGGMGWGEGIWLPGGACAGGNHFCAEVITSLSEQ